MDVSTVKTTEFIRQYLEALGCARSLTVWLLFSFKEHDQLVALGFNPLDYAEVNDARDSLAATKFLSKATFLKTSFSLEEVALGKFFDSEQVCRNTNLRIRKSTFKNPLTSHSLSWMRGKISDILGEFDADELADYAGWGPGATTKLSRRQATFPNKYDLENHITRDAYEFIIPWFHLAYPMWGYPPLGWQMVPGSKLVTVPKDSKSHRTIAIEPGLNLWFQKAIGSMLRKRLLRDGIDLNQQSRNQELSRVAAKHNLLATVDFSSASDTIASQLIEELIPGKWLALLTAFRSTSVRLDDKIIPLEKFSSMGNGFTFELETLIFYALALYVKYAAGAEGQISVYGDDVILPSCVFDTYASISEDLGFTVNKGKSYSSSMYRESCGAHWWGGVDIKPIFLKEPLNGRIHMLQMANAVRLSAHRRNHSFGCDQRFESCWRFLVDNLGRNPPRVSAGYGDIALIDDFENCTDVVQAGHGIEGYYVRIWVPLARTVHCSKRGLLLSKLRVIGEDSGALRPDLKSGGNDVPLPLRTRTARVRVLIPRWVNLGPWC